MTILNTEIVSNYDLIRFLAVLCIVVGLCSVVFLAVGINEDKPKYYFLCLLTILLGISIIYQIFHIEEEYTRYAIIFNDENPITAQEFLEKYEVLKVNGKIYTIREREDEVNGN